MTQLPSNLKLLPGIRSDHRGRKYQMAQYPSGKTVPVPYSDTDAPPARMIPVAEEPKPRIRGKVVTTDSGDGKRKPVISPRLHCIEYRWKGDLGLFENEDHSVFNDWLLMQLKPLMRSPDCGKTWIPVEPVSCDFHVCYHKDK